MAVAPPEPLGKLATFSRPSPARTARALVDVLTVFIISVLASIYAARLFDFTLPPFEDAAILMRYAQHLSDGYGLVWNVGDPPVDGATDFLYTLIIAAVARLGVSLENAVLLTGFLSHFGTVVAAYLSVRRIFNRSAWFAGASATFVAFGPAFGYISAYFGTPFFGFMSSLTFYFALNVMARNGSTRSSALYAFSSLTMGLTRPEGVLLGCLMLLSIIVYKGWRRSLETLKWFFGVMAILGGAYFLWRWQYFGYPLPNPFYKKGGGELHVDGFLTATRSMTQFCLPFLLLVGFAWRSRESRRWAVALSIPILGFTAIWMLLSPETNYLGRFQYVLLPLCAMSWPGLIAGWHIRPLARPARVALGVALIALLAVYDFDQFAQSRFADGRYNVAQILAAYRDRGYVLATSEAGLLPFYSGWRAVDTWGLNDQWITHNGGITVNYLQRYAPTLIVVHEAPYSPAAWKAMSRLMREYATEHAYTLVAAFGVSRDDTHEYYLAPGLDDAQKIATEIRAVRYIWLDDGSTAVNFAAL